jgi:hypothetical protein
MLIINGHMPAFTDKSLLVDSPLHPKAESQRTDLAWSNVESDMPHFLGCLPHTAP